MVDPPSEQSSAALESLTRSFVAKVEQRVAVILTPPPAASLADPPSVLREASLHLLSAGGKRLRPQLVVLLGRLLDAKEEALLRIAVAVELIHAASLLHDDVVDEGKWRRGLATANAQWGNSVAVLAGDWLLSHAILEIAPLGPQTMLSAVETVAEMAGAAMREVEARGRTDLTASAWRSIAEGKAGALFGWCGTAVALASRRKSVAPTINRAGRSLGVAFQMADDLKDVCDAQLGKDRYADLRNQNPSFALSLAMDQSPALRDRLREVWRDGRIGTAEAHRLGTLVLATGLVPLATQALEQEVEAALAPLRELASEGILGHLTSLAYGFFLNSSQSSAETEAFPAATG